jgi:hypothetical protein
MKIIEKTAEVKVGANFKALKKEIQSLKDALKSQEATHENLMNAKVPSSVRPHEREMASLKQHHKSERGRMDLALCPAPTRKLCDRKMPSAIWSRN